MKPVHHLWAQDVMIKVDVVEHNSQNTSVKAVFTKYIIPTLILAEYLTSDVQFVSVL